MTTAIILGVVGPWQIILIIIVVLLLFGGKKIPELMHGIGKGIKSFKEGMSGEDDKDQKDKEESKKE